MIALAEQLQTLAQATLAVPAQACLTLHFETPHHFFDAHLFNHDRLIVSFEDARGKAERPSPHRPGFGVPAFLKRGTSVLAVKPKRMTWYSHPELPEVLESLRPFFQGFGEVVTYGMSSGGFAALTYADLIGADRVVALAPQSTYRKVGGRQETRFPLARDFDHSGPFGDAVTGCLTPKAIWLLYDRMEQTDKWHAGRIPGAQVRHVGLPFFSHGVMRMLNSLGLLSSVTDLVVTGQIDLDAFYRGLRPRREYAQYLDFLQAKAGQHPHVQARLKRLLQL